MTIHTNTDTDAIRAKKTTNATVELTFDEKMESILTDLRTRNPETPTLEFCDGFLTALVCCRRTLSDSEFIPMLLDIGDDIAQGSFKNTEQETQFFELWEARKAEVKECLEADVSSLSEDLAFEPIAMDSRVMYLLADEESQKNIRNTIAVGRQTSDSEMNIQSTQATSIKDFSLYDLPSFGQLWALGFMFFVENSEDEWTVSPKNKEAFQAIEQSLQCIIDLTQDDNEPFTESMDTYPEEHPNAGEPLPLSMSTKRIECFAQSIWSIYDLYAVGRNLGPRVIQIHNPNKLGRNDPCHCGSGEKLKKCHGK